MILIASTDEEGHLFGLANVELASIIDFCPSPKDPTRLCVLMLYAAPVRARFSEKTFADRDEAVAWLRSDVGVELY